MHEAWHQGEGDFRNQLNGDEVGVELRERAS